MYYSTKKVRPGFRDYIVVKHPLRSVGNSWLNGVKFVNGCAVVEKNGKSHKMIRRNPLFKKRQEFDLSYLPKCGFRTKDISIIFGKDIYYSYLETVGLNSDLTPKQPKIENPSEELKVSTQVEPETEVKEQDEILELGELDVVPQKAIKEIKVHSEIQEQSSEIEFKDQEEELPQLTTEEVINAHKEINLCISIKNDGNVCKGKVSKGSPSGHYCFGHIKKDPQLKRNLTEE